MTSNWFPEKNPGGPPYYDVDSIAQMYEVPLRPRHVVGVECKEVHATRYVVEYGCPSCGAAV